MYLLSMASSSSLITPPPVPIMASSQSPAPLISSISPCCRRLFNSITVRQKPISAISMGSRISTVAPWLMLPPTFKGGDMVYNLYNFTNKRLVYFNAPEEAEFGGDTEVVGSSHGFLALFHKRTHALFLYNPLSGITIELPSIHTLSLRDIGLGPIDMRVTKVIISHDQSRAMIIYGPADRLAFCCPGRSTEWTPLGALFTHKKYYYLKGRAYCDIVYSERDKVFICCTDYDMEQWDLRLSRAGKQLNSVYQLEFEPNEKYQPAWWYDIMTKEEEERRLISIEDDAIEKETYVVFAEHSNQLYVVYRYIMKRGEYMKYSCRDGFPERDWDDSYPHKTIGFSVYKVTRVGVGLMLQLSYIEEGFSLDNLVMFLGRNHSFEPVLPAQDYPDLKPNSIYFTDNPRHTPIDWQTYGAHDTAIYDYNNRTFHPFDYRPANDVSSIKGIVPPPLWFNPSLH